MAGVIVKPGVEQKLEILSADAQYDLACACGSTKDEHRRRGRDGRWVYPVTLPNGGRTTLFKTLMSNACSNDCKYCPLRQQVDVRRCGLTAEETARVFLDYYGRREVFGLFLSSAVCGSADATMERLNRVARLLRKRHKFRGYIHLKIIPGAGDAAIAEAVSLSSAVSLNIETPGGGYLEKLSAKKDYIKDIIEPIKLISRLTGRGNKYERVKQTTQFIVGAAGETDAEIVKYTWGLYKRLGMGRVYFSAYQRGLGDQSLPAEQIEPAGAGEIFAREHRLYQVDFLLRRYGFSESDIVFGEDGNLFADTDPKEGWALKHPEFFPVNINRASRWQLLRVPGLGPVTADKILQRRRTARLGRIEHIGKVGVRLRKAQDYITF